MNVYHGTIMEYAEKIQRSGLKPITTEAFQLEDSAGVTLRSIERVRAHVTMNLELAKHYAEYRTKYEKAHKGQLVGMPGIFPTYRKTSDMVIPSATPAVVTFNLPDDWHLIPDKNDLRGAFISAAIPAEYVTSITEVPYEYRAFLPTGTWRNVPAQTGVGTYQPATVSDTLKPDANYFATWLKEWHARNARNLMAEQGAYYMAQLDSQLSDDAYATGGEL